MSRHRRPPLLVLGLDGATFDVIEPLAAAGHLPHLERWMAEGWRAPLRSTVPPMSFPAWSTFLTGLEPGAHGLYDFTQKLPGAYRIRFTNATDRRGASLFARASAAGRRVLALGVPATFPPEPVNGLLVPGFDAPVSTGTDPRSASDPTLYRRIAARAGPWRRPDLDEGSRGTAWHEGAAAVLAERVDRKRDFALAALAELGEVDLVAVVFAESDTVAHHFWRDWDPASPRRDPAASAIRQGAVRAVYERLDAACGALREAVGPEARCAVLSDHGAGGASRRVVHVGRLLADAGLLRRRRARVPALDGLARSARDLALRALPPAAAERIFRRARGAAAQLESAARFGGIDWRHTAAFCEEVNTQPGIWINLRGREAAGAVAAGDYERVRDDVISLLAGWTLPGGGPVVRWARRREEVYRGPRVEDAPDVVFELALEAGYAHSLVPTPWGSRVADAVRTLADDELAGGRGRGLNGTHRSDGIWITAGPDAPALALPEPPRLRDVAPALLAALGVTWDAADGGPAVPYSAEDEARVAARLRALGYLE